jgi:hypothetical protein
LIGGRRLVWRDGDAVRERLVRPVPRDHAGRPRDPGGIVPAGRGSDPLCRGDGVASFNALRRGDGPERALHCAFDLLMLDGQDLRSEPIEVRKGLLNDRLDHPQRLFRGGWANRIRPRVRVGREGIVSKLKGSRYRSGMSRNWVKSKNPASEAVRREREENWRR